MRFQRIDPPRRPLGLSLRYHLLHHHISPLPASTRSRATSTSVATILQSTSALTHPPHHPTGPSYIHLSDSLQRVSPDTAPTRIRTTLELPFHRQLDTFRELPNPLAVVPPRVPLQQAYPSSPHLHLQRLSLSSLDSLSRTRISSASASTGLARAHLNLPTPPSPSFGLVWLHTPDSEPSSASMATVVPRAKKQRTLPDELIGLAPLPLQGVDPNDPSMLAHQQPIPPHQHPQQYPYTAASSSNMSAASGSRPARLAPGFQRVNEVIGGKVCRLPSIGCLRCSSRMLLTRFILLLPPMRTTSSYNALPLITGTRGPCHRRRYTTTIKSTQRPGGTRSTSGQQLRTRQRSPRSCALPFHITRLRGSTL